MILLLAPLPFKVRFVKVDARAIFVFDIVHHSIGKLFEVLTAPMARFKDPDDPNRRAWSQLDGSISADFQPISPCE